MSIAMEILREAWNTHLNYKGVRVNLFGIPILWDENKKCPKNSFDKTLARLTKRGLVEKRKGECFLTQAGKEYFERQNKLMKKFSSPFTLNTPKNLLLMFDIPESRKAERNWLRWHLREFQYFMIQKSVWVGPSPLPRRFVEYIKEMKIYSYIKTFKLAKPYPIKNRAL